MTNADVVTGERLRRAEKALTDELPAVNPLWKPWAMDLADDVNALVAERDDLRAKYENATYDASRWERNCMDEINRAEDLQAERDEARERNVALETQQITDALGLRDTRLEAAEAEVARLREALADFAEHGTRFDCNPTVMVHNTPEWVASQEWWQNRATQMDVAVRNRARAALAWKDGISQGHMMDVKGEMGGYQG